MKIINFSNKLDNKLNNHLFHALKVKQGFPVYMLFGLKITTILKSTLHIKLRNQINDVLDDKN